MKGPNIYFLGASNTHLHNTFNQQTQEDAGLDHEEEEEEEDEEDEEEEEAPVRDGFELDSRSLF
jgi:hypothetical protein